MELFGGGLLLGVTMPLTDLETKATTY